MTEVVVIGAGPSGIVAALHLAKSGISVTVIDQKKTIGLPKKCAEGITLSVLSECGIPIEKSWISMEFSKAKIFPPDGKGVVIDLGARIKCTIDRPLFEHDLSLLAKKAGAKFLLEHEAISLVLEGGHATGIICKTPSGRKSIHCCAIICADGASGRISSSLAGPMKDVITCFQYELSGIITEPVLSLYFGEQIAPGGYAWIFPKSGTRANVGLGIKAKGNTRDFLDRFIAENPNIFSGHKVVGRLGGIVPVRPRIKMTYGNVLLIGDCGGTVNPLHGGGIELGMKSGILAARIITENNEDLRIGNFGALKDFEKQWNASYGRRLSALYKGQKFLYSLDDQSFNRFIHAFSAAELQTLYHGSTQSRLAILARKAPRLVPIAARYLL
jgi:digeranylgeranylglycerophospholipid reductase